MKEPTVVNVQRYSVCDGGGTCITILFKDCLLNCWWYYNPKSQKYISELMSNREKCSGCGYCRKACSHGAIMIREDGIAHTDTDRCMFRANCPDYCLHNNHEVVGKQYNIKELMTIVNKDAHFHEESGGSVTLSGKEVMTRDTNYLEELCRQLKDKRCNVTIDTRGYMPKESYVRLLSCVDIFLCGIRTLNDEAHKKYMGESNGIILGNLEPLMDHRAGINIRIPVVVPVSSDADTILDIITYLEKRVGIAKVNLLLYYNTGNGKYEELGRVHPAANLSVPSQEHMEMLKPLFEKHDFQQMEIGG